MAVNSHRAYCTLLMNDEYLPGALVLAHSLRDTGAQVPLIILVTKDVHEWALNQLTALYDQVIQVDPIINKTPSNLYLMGRPDLISTFTKINLWRQTQFDRLVYVDADVVALRAPDELFDLEAPFAAVPDTGWPDCFNSGVMSLKPNMGDYYALLALAQRGVSFDGADQGLLNTHFRAWHRLSFSYNCTPSGNYQYVPAYRHFQSTISLVHYIGRDKPWMGQRNFRGASNIYEELLGRWWSVHDRYYRGPTPSYMSAQSAQHLRNGQQYMEARTSNADNPYGSTGTSVEEQRSSEGSVIRGHDPLRGQPESASHVQLGQVTSFPSLQPRQFSVQWDPAREPPPINSRPEALNFPNQVYNMSADPRLFQPPKTYTEPPPKQERLKPIFPWEERQTKATRVFPEDFPSSAQTTPSVTTDDDTSTGTTMPASPTLRADSPQSFASYSRTNVWDEHPGIQRYMAKLLQKRRGKTDGLPRKSSLGSDVPHEGPEDVPIRRRPSIILTDFPTEVERPSLPVTPAPIRRPCFWGEERDAAGELPRAEGVPIQSEWDPAAKLGELQRRQSQVLAEGPKSPSREIPKRSMIGSEPEVVVAEDSTPLASLKDFNFTEGGRAPSEEDAPEVSPIS